jgi:hypothetical protein
MFDIAAAEQEQEAPALQSFALKAFDIGEDGEEDVELILDLPVAPSINRHASLALLYGLAIMMLDQDGSIQRRMDQILDQGAISEIDAVNHIQLLLLKDENDRVI